MFMLLNSLLKINFNSSQIINQINKLGNDILDITWVNLNKIFNR